jgi:hypothetical protein
VVLEAHCGGDVRKDLVADGRRQSGCEGDQLCTQNNPEGESLSESPKSNTHKVCQTSRSNIKIKLKNNTPIKRQKKKGGNMAN